MSRIFSTILITTIGFFLLFLHSPMQVSAQARNINSINVQLNVVQCNYDLMCDAGEVFDSCPSDCEAVATSSTSTPSIIPEAPIQSAPIGGTSRGSEEQIRQSLNMAKDFYAYNFFGNVLLLWTPPRLNEYPLVPSFLQPNPFVRILRSTTGFPTGPLDEGIVVYEGRGTTFFDTDVENGIRYFYSLFVKDPSTGKYSWGSYASVFVSKIMKQNTDTSTSSSNISISSQDKTFNTIDQNGFGVDTSFFDLNLRNSTSSLRSTQTGTMIITPTSTMQYKFLYQSTPLSKWSLLMTFVYQNVLEYLLLILTIFILSFVFVRYVL